MTVLMQAMMHRLKVLAWPHSAAVAGWIEEEIRFRQDAADRFSPSMLQRIDLARAYRRALQRMPHMIDGLPPGPLPDVCPWTLDALLDGDTGLWSPDA